MSLFTQNPRFREALIGLPLGAAIGLFVHVMGLPTLVSYWGAGAPVVGLCALVFSGLAACLGFKRGRLMVAACLLTMQALYLVVVITPVSLWLARGLPRQDALTAADAVFVFGSKVQDDGELSDVALSRLMRGLEVLGEGHAPRLVLSELPPPSRSYKEAALKLMHRLGMKQEVIAVGPVINSRDEAKLVSELYRQRGWKKVVAVTSPTHSRRACATLEHAGVNVVCVPCAETRFDLERLTDAESRLHAFGAAIHERLGLWVYARRGWIASNR